MPNTLPPLSGWYRVDGQPGFYLNGKYVRIVRPAMWGKPGDDYVVENPDGDIPIEQYHPGARKKFSKNEIAGGNPPLKNNQIVVYRYILTKDFIALCKDAKDAETPIQ